MDVESDITEAGALVAAGRPQEALDRLLAVAARPETPVEQAVRARIDALVVALRMYDLRTAHDQLALLDAEGLAEPWRSRARLLDLVVRGLLGDGAAVDRLIAEVVRRLDGPVPASELRFIGEGLTLAIARSGRRDDLLEVVLRVEGMARDLGLVDLGTTLLVAEAAYRSRSDLAGGALVAERALRQATETDDWRNLPFALAQAANAHAGLGDAVALDEADQLERFAAPAALMVAGLARASFALTTGDSDRAYDLVLDLDTRFDNALSRVVSWHADLTELALARGHVDVAVRAATSVREVAEVSGIPWLTATADRCASLLESDLAAAEQLVDRAIARFDGGGYLISSSRTRLSWAQRLRALDDARWAEVTASAQRGFEAAGMAMWAARCVAP